MKRQTMAIILGFMFSSFSHAGLLITEENDVIFGDDSQYTQGAEFRWFMEPIVDGDSALVRTFSIKNQFYTPKDIINPNPQPNDRPWGGLTAVSYGELKSDDFVLTHWEMFAGVAGDWSHSDDIQEWFHRSTHNKMPGGWSNQIPNEVVLNVQGEASKNMIDMFVDGKRVFGIEGGVVADVGTAFMDVGIFNVAKLGWNVPACRGVCGINPKALESKSGSVYMFGGWSEKGVLHNITLNGSIWQDGPHQDLERLVTDLWWGGTVGWSIAGFEMSMSFTARRRSKEFVGQAEDQQWGELALGLGKTF